MKLLFALLLAILTTGCGGGGGGSATLTPANAVAARTVSWRTAQVNENLNAFLEHYSTDFTGDGSGSKAGVQESTEAMFADFDILRADPLSETHTVAPSGQLVISEIDVQYTVRARASGNTGLMRLQGMLEWAREGSAWRILRGELIEVGA